MTLLDWLIVSFVALFAIYGYAQGFIVGALSLAGFAVGGFLGTRFGPQLLDQGAQSPYAPLFGLAGALIAGAILAAGLEGIGLNLRERVTGQSLNIADGVLGSLLTAAVALGIAWIGGAVALQVPGRPEVRKEVQRSEVLRRLNATLPPSGSILNALARLDPSPAIDGPRANVGPPPPGIGRDPQVRAASDSVVRILGTACGLGVSGSGWSAGSGLVVTNAHVVAGQDDTTVQVEGEGSRLDAEAVVFDARNDLAVLRVDGFDQPALPLAEDDDSGTPAAILGFPENGPYRVEPGRLGATRTVLSQDAYDRGPVSRSITSLRGKVRSGSSGGPMVDGRGRVATTIFASTVGGGQDGGYGVPNAVVRRALADVAGGVSTGPCTR